MTLDGTSRGGSAAQRRGGSRRLAALALALVAATFALFVAGPWVWHHYLTRDGAQDIHEVATLPGSLHPCERSYGRSRRGGTRTAAELRALLGPELPVVDTLPLTSCLTGLSAACPAGNCTPTVVWVRVGEDAYVSYSLRGGP